MLSPTMTYPLVVGWLTEVIKPRSLGPAGDRINGKGITTTATLFLCLVIRSTTSISNLQVIQIKVAITIITR